MIEKSRAFSAVARRITLAVFTAVLILSTVPAHALICGDGFLDELLLEECDDGNNVPGDCCSPFCQYEPADTVCRASTGTCDPEETCTGSSDVCPADLIIPDGDLDQVCDPDDLCPLIPDPLQDDVDLDGIGDACDYCVNPDETTLLKTKMTLSKLDLPVGNDRFRLKASGVLPDGPPIDPVTNGLALRVTDGLDIVAVEATIPGGAFDRFTRSGWRVNGNFNVFTFRSQSDDPDLGGIRRITLKTNPTQPRAFKIVVVGREGVYVKPTEAPVTVATKITPQAPGQCAESQFNAFEGGPRCVFLNNSARLICR
jgi:cysteine-rich repeat protein